MTPAPALAGLLAHWHHWRRGYSHERGLTRLAAFDEADPDAQLEDLQMLTLETEIAALPQDFQLALQHVARAEALGADVISSPRLGDKANRDRLIVQALTKLQDRLRYLDLL